MEGRSIFFTGSAGTGKSFLMRKIITDLKEKYAKDSVRDAVYITAPTGMAACAIGGTTLHSFAGISTQNKSQEKMAATVCSNKACKSRWVACRTLVIDEVSMVDGELFDKLDYVARCARGSARPFGGIQVILAGDFYQLPPVGLDQQPKKSDSGRNQQRSDDEPQKAAIFCFESKVWNQLLYAQMSLLQVFRQSDPRFVTILNEMRVGKLSPQSIQLIRNCGGGLRRLETENPQLKATKLFAVNALVDQLNDSELAKCPGELRKFKARDEGEVNELRNMAVLPELDLKLGAQVILLKNLDTEAGLVNGARGYVSDFEAKGTPSEHPIVIFERPGHPSPSIPMPIPRSEFTFELGSRIIATRSQIPLKLAYAISIHKSQGMTIDCLDVCLDKVFEYGQAYVALSRAVSIDRLRVSGFDPKKVMTHPRVIAFYNKLINATSPEADALLKKSRETPHANPIDMAKVKVSPPPPPSTKGTMHSFFRNDKTSSLPTSSLATSQSFLPKSGARSVQASLAGRGGAGRGVGSKSASISASSAALLKSQEDRIKAQSYAASRIGIAPSSFSSGKATTSSFSATSILLPVVAPTLTASQEQQIMEYTGEDD
jgi:ATP-dependent DNA helicase PIF1